MKKTFNSIMAVLAIAAVAAVGFLQSCASKAHAALFGYMASQGLVLGAAPMRSTDFRPIVEPILNKVFDGVYEQRKDEWQAIFTQIDGTPRAYHEEPVMFGFNAAPEMPDGTPVTYQQGGVLFNKRYVYRIYGLAYAMTRTLVEDGDHIRLGKIFAQHLAQSLIETKETLTANVLNRGFNASFVGGDGVSLFNASHPIVTGTFSNLLTTSAALSQTSLEQMLIQIRKAVDNNGKRIRLQNKKLFVSPDNVFQAEVLLKSVLRAGTNNNDINPIKSAGSLDADPAVVTRLSSPTMWGVTTDAPTGLQLVMRASLQKGMEGDFETDSMRFKGTERYDVGWTDPRGAYATPGV